MYHSTYVKKNLYLLQSKINNQKIVMSITGNLADFSLPELIQFLDQGEKTGKLNLNFDPHESLPGETEHYIWFRQGRIVAASNLKDGSGLMSIIKKKKWLNDEIIKYKNDIYRFDVPLGLSLKSEGFLDAEQLKMLFYSQVLRKVSNLFQLHSAEFVFEENAPLAFSEMTGLSSPGQDLTLAGLRALMDWSGLSSKLPEETSALKNIVEDEPTISINKSEKKVWELSDGVTTIKKMAEQLDMSLEKVKEIGFRLIAIGLGQEIPMVSVTENIVTQSNDSEENNSGLSDSFLSGLMDFLTDV